MPNKITHQTAIDLALVLVLISAAFSFGIMYHESTANTQSINDVKKEILAFKAEYKEDFKYLIKKIEGEQSLKGGRLLGQNALKKVAINDVKTN